MKKVKLIILLLMVLLSGLSLAILIVFSNNKTVDEELYSIIEAKSYVIDENRQVSFTIYSKKKNSLILYTEKNNYVLKLDSISFSLENVYISKYKVDSYYLIKIYADMPKVTQTEYSSETAYLEISNQEFNVALFLGKMSFLSSDYHELLSINSLSGSYSYINGELELVGINIEFANKYNYLQELRIGNFGYGMLFKSIKGVYYDSEIEILNVVPSYNYNHVAHEYIKLQDDKYFIPIGYNELILIKGGYIVVTLDGVNYYIDAFDFMVNEIDLNNYPNKVSKGVISYVDSK